MREKHRETQGPEPGLPGVEITQHGASYKQGAPLEYKVSGTGAGTRGIAIGAARPFVPVQGIFLPYHNALVPTGRLDRAREPGGACHQ